MNLLHRVLLACSLVAFTEPGRAENSNLVDQARQKLEQALRTIETHRQTSVDQAPEIYKRYLAELETNFQSEGDLEGVLAIRKERDRFTEKKAVNAEDLVMTPEKLRLYQQLFMDAPQAAEATANERIADTAKAYVIYMEQLKEELTKRGDINQAIMADAEAKRARTAYNLGDEPLVIAETKPAQGTERLAPEPAQQPRFPIPAGPYPGRNWTSPSTGMEFIWITTMRMWVGKYEVTNEEYRKYSPRHDSGQTSFGKRNANADRQPVIRVSLSDADHFADWMTTQDKVGQNIYRLPSRAEWTTYAQCGRNWKYPWGSTYPPVSGQAGNYHGLESSGNWGKVPGYNDGFATICFVEQSWQNPWGLYGVGGNVYEMVRDRNGTAYYGGGTWLGWEEQNLRCSEFSEYSRAKNYPGSLANMGFRLVLVTR